MIKIGRKWAAVLILLAGGAGQSAESESAKAKRMEELKKYTVTLASSKDGAEQKAVFYTPSESGDSLRPLLVALHTWSGNYDQGLGYLGPARDRGWVLIAPDFRGPNQRPEACASELAVQDVLDAVEYAKRQARIDAARIYLVGASGGGHMSLVMAARAPKVWTAVSAWVPISDLAAWHAQNSQRGGHYSQMLERVCGGAPGPQTEKEYAARSPLFGLAAAAGLPLDINVGIHDGHTGSVPVSQSLNAFNVLAEANGLADRRLSPQAIDFMTKQQAVPPELAAEREDDPERTRAVLFRRAAGAARITVFEGGHDSEVAAALNWLARQRRGKPADFSLGQGAAKAEPGARPGAQQVAP